MNYYELLKNKWIQEMNLFCLMVVLVVGNEWYLILLLDYQKRAWDRHDQEMYVGATTFAIPPGIFPGKGLSPQGYELRIKVHSQSWLWVMGYGYWLWLWFWIVNWSYQVLTKSSTFAIAHFLLRKFDICWTYWNYIPKTFLNS